MRSSSSASSDEMNEISIAGPALRNDAAAVLLSVHERADPARGNEPSSAVTFHDGRNCFRTSGQDASVAASAGAEGQRAVDDRDVVADETKRGQRKLERAPLARDASRERLTEDPLELLTAAPDAAGAAEHPVIAVAVEHRGNSGRVAARPRGRQTHERLENGRFLLQG